MSSKLRKTIGAVKDQTSISLAKVGSAANLEVAILKATTHDEIPMDDRYVNEILQMVSSNKVYAAACAQAIGKRITKTKDWVVALKSLMLVLRIFQDGDPYFPREVLHLMKRGVKILNLNNFRDDSSSCPWDYTAFVRTFALYLDERLDCFVTGKLQRRFIYHGDDCGKQSKLKSRSKRADEPGIIDAKPSKLLDRISYWQRLLDRAIGTVPTGEAKTNRLIQISLYAVVQESFDLYRDISDGITLLLDSFFQLQYDSCVSALQACVKSSNQFDELSSFYDSCKSIGVGRTSEYPCVQKASEELIETLQDFLKDQANSFPSQNGRSVVNKHLLLPGTPKSTGSSSRRHGSYPQSEMSMRSSDFSACASLEDLMVSTDADRASASRSTENHSYNLEQFNEKQFECEDCSTRFDPSVSRQHSLSAKQETDSSVDLVFFDNWQQGQPEKQKEQQQHGRIQRDCWELVLGDAATKTEEPFQKAPTGVDPFGIDHSFVSSSIPYKQSYNPFLEDVEPVIPTPPVATSNTVNQGVSLSDLFGPSSAFEYEAPTFHVDTSLGTQNMSPSLPPPSPPTFIARSSSQNSMSTASSTRSLDLTSPTPSFGFQNSQIPMLPPILAQNANETMAAPSFHAESYDEITAAPTFSARSFEETTSSPTFSATSFEEIAAAPTFSARTLYNSSPAAPTFSARTFFNSSPAAPTFSARKVEQTAAAAATFFANKSDQMSSSQFESDPFSSVPVAITSEQQQQMWLEQQQKILAKRLAL